MAAAAGARVRGHRASAVLAVVLVTLVAVTAFLAAPARGQEAGPTVSLDPDRGDRGSSVSAAGRGFANCPATGGDDVRSSVVLRWDDEVVVATPAVDDEGGFAASFLVPDDASPGEHPVVVRCDGDAGLVATDAFTVTGPVGASVLVPDVVGLPLDQARARLAEAELTVGAIDGDGGVVAAQDPLAGTEAPVGAAVQVTLATVVPDDAAGGSWWLVALGLAVTTIAAWPVVRVSRRTRQRRWVERHLRTDARAGQEPTVEVADTAPEAASHVVRVVVRHEPSAVELEGVGP